MILLDASMKAFSKNHYGEDFYWFFAKVVSDSDPDYLGRVQIRVYGIHSQDQSKLPDSHLPWAQCLIPSTEGGISGIGQHSKILPGALVFGFFMDGRSCQIPFVLGAIHHYELPLITQSDNNSLGERFDEFSRLIFLSLPAPCLGTHATMATAAAIVGSQLHCG